MVTPSQETFHRLSFYTKFETTAVSKHSTFAQRLDPTETRYIPSSFWQTFHVQFIMPSHGDEVGIYCLTERIRVVGINLEVSVNSIVPCHPTVITYDSCDQRRPSIISLSASYVEKDPAANRTLLIRIQNREKNHSRGIRKTIRTCEQYIQREVKDCMRKL